MISDAVKLGERGRIQEAKDIEKQLRRDFPNGPEAKWLSVWIAYLEKDYTHALALGMEFLNVNPSVSSVILPTLASAAMLKNRDAMDRAISLIPLRSRALPVCAWAPAFEQAMEGRLVQTSPPTRLRIGAEHIRPFISFLMLHGEPALQRAPAPVRAAFFTECLGPGTDANFPEIARIIEGGAWRADMAEHDAAILRLESLGVRIQMTELARAERYKAQQQWDKFDSIMADILPLRRSDSALWLDHARSLYQRGKYPESLTFSMHALKILPPNHLSIRFLALGNALMSHRPEDAWPILIQLSTLAPSKVIQWIKDNQDEPEFRSLRADPRFIKLVHGLNWRDGQSLVLAPSPEEQHAISPAAPTADTRRDARRTIRYAAGAIAALGMAGLLVWEKRRRHSRQHRSRHHPSSQRYHNELPNHEAHSAWSPKKERMRAHPSRNYGNP